MALNKKKAKEKNKIDEMLEGMENREKDNSVNGTIEELKNDNSSIKGTSPPENSGNGIKSNIPIQGNDFKQDKTQGDANNGKKEERKKHPGGRPTHESLGKTKRKQYTLTLDPDMYADIMRRASDDGLSFAKYIERSVKEYIQNHS